MGSRGGRVHPRSRRGAIPAEIHESFRDVGATVDLRYANPGQPRSGRMCRFWPAVGEMQRFRHHFAVASSARKPQRRTHETLGLSPLVLVLLAGGVWTAVDNYRIKHPVSGREMTVPGQNGANAMLVSGWKTTPAGRQLASGDMILSGQVSPDGTLFAFTNTGYTGHAPAHRRSRHARKRSPPSRWSRPGAGWRSPPMASGSTSRAARAIRSATSSTSIAGTRKAGRKRARASRSSARPRTTTAVSSLNVSADGKLLYALNNSDDHLYILETHGGRALAPPEGRRPSAVRRAVEGRQDALCRQSRRRECRHRGRQRSEPADRHRDARDRPASERSRPHRRRPPLRLLRQQQQRDLVRSQDQAAARSDQHGPRPEGAGRQHAELARPVARWRDALCGECRQQLGRGDRRGGTREEPAARLPADRLVPDASSRPPADGKRVIVASGKGVGTGPSRVKRPIDPIAPAVSFQHHGNQLNGLVSFIDTPDANEARGITRSRSTTTRSIATRCSRRPAPAPSP